MQDTSFFPGALAMAYMRFQVLGSTYAARKALAQGTLFPDLDKPFLAERQANCP